MYISPHLASVAVFIVDINVAYAACGKSFP